MTANTQLKFEEARSFLLSLAKERGVQLEVFAQRGTETTVQAFGGQVSEFKLSSKQGVGLRALSNGAWGYAYTENLSRDALSRAFRSAVENAELVEPAPHAVLAAHAEPPAMDLFGEGLSGVTVERKVAVALRLEQAAKESDARVVTVPYAEYSDGESETAVANTEGLDRAFKELHAYQYLGPLVAEDGQNKMKMAFQVTREFEELDPTATALEATRKALALLGARPAPSGVFPAVIENECMALLLAVFSGIFSGKMVEEGKSPLASKLGERIGSDLVTILDDATLERGLSSRPFDAEGYPSAPVTLVQGGELRGFLHNTETAAKAGVSSTGHASRPSYKGTVGVSPTNFVLASGEGTRDDLLTQLGTGLLLTDVQGVHAGANPITGEFSLQAEGFWVENGVVAYPLDVFTVAGNFLDLLRSVEAVGSDTKMSIYGAIAPSVRISSINVGGQ
ncbi:TldD/PmbA family protein [Deinococcus yavapaiensis]|uniref:PmbA protein n=1 Tax=Deinococcus yavapaiensis KR-236 TaxID=694435 RepID=A0A318S8I5_9DEIO|nr:TldD/PmbA family protein [Deinococcus yavapaiensis]PYE55347.1 PmbA protein [Deinococcus yavapaiensis KR-236]